MRDITLLGFTLLAMRDLGEGRARLVREDRNHQGWFAGGQPLNGQAVQDLIADGWLRRDGDKGDVRIDAWPSFAMPMAERRPRPGSRNRAVRRGCDAERRPSAPAS